ncbi:hypothetical protein VNO80_31565 [Phaseolus coccineus]|uniref:Uncharacterized protein n=1 Tax=Phaseolus coccineus TaxID=3886 RepID=A0AAN9Q720_PHACN
MIKVPLPLPLLLSFHLSHQHSFSVFTSCFPMQDRVRTETYREAIMQYQSFIAGKVVVDVGRGTGILSIFCAQAVAKRLWCTQLMPVSDIALQVEIVNKLLHIFTLNTSFQLVTFFWELANEVVKANNLSDVVVVLHGRVERNLKTLRQDGNYMEALRRSVLLWP